MNNHDNDYLPSQFAYNMQPIPSAPPLIAEYVNCDVLYENNDQSYHISDTFDNPVEFFHFSEIYLNKYIYTKNLKLNLNEMLSHVLVSDNLKNIIPVKITITHKNIIEYIIKTHPSYFILFEKLFSMLIVNEEQWNPIVVPYIIIIFKKIYNVIYDYRIKHFLCGVKTKKLCKTVIDFILYVVILNDLYLYKNNNILQKNIKKLLNVCLDLIDKPRAKTIYERITELVTSGSSTGLFGRWSFDGGARTCIVGKHIDKSYGRTCSTCSKRRLVCAGHGRRSQKWSSRR